MSFLVYPTIKQSPILSMAGFGGGGTALALGGAAPLVTYTMTKSSSHDNWKEGTGLGSECSQSNSTGVSHASNTMVTMTLSFSPDLPSITDWSICVRNAGSNGFNIQYAFNSGAYSNTGVTGSTATVVDLTSAAQSAGTVQDFQLKGGNGSGNTHIYLSYLRINNVYVTGNSATSFTFTM